MNREKFLKDLARLPAISLDQTRRFYAEPGEHIRRAIRALEKKGLIEVTAGLVRGREVAEPLAIVTPNGPRPHAGKLAYRAESLWSDTFSASLILQATAKLASLYGGEVRTVATCHLSHEIGLAEVLLRKSQRDPSFDWTLISTRPGTGALPDAVSASGDLFIELVGRYSGEMVSAKIELSANAAIELW